jgi:hypothetical protein
MPVDANARAMRQQLVDETNKRSKVFVDFKSDRLSGAAGAHVHP